MHPRNAHHNINKIYIVAKIAPNKKLMTFNIMTTKPQ